MRRWPWTEMAITLVGLVALSSSLWMIWDHFHGGSRLLRDGTCVQAQVTGTAKPSLPRQAGRLAELSYEVNDRSYLATAGYDDVILKPGQSIAICVDPDNPTTFTFQPDWIRGDSLGRWLRGTILCVLLAVAGTVALAVALKDRDWLRELSPYHKGK